MWGRCKSFQRKVLFLYVAKIYLLFLLAVGLGDFGAWWYMMVALGPLLGKVGCVSMAIGRRTQFPCGLIANGSKMVLARSTP